MSDSIVKAKDLHKSYLDTPGRVDVLRGITLEIKRGEFVAIQGPSGAGKSTLLHILGGLDSPTSGEVVFEKENLYALRENERALLRNRKIGFVFQFYHLLPEFNVLENVMLPGFLTSWWEKKRVRLEAEGILERVGLAHRLSHRPAQLSGGEQQRVAIARSLINRPNLLLCDEPTGNLDSESGNNILNLLKQVNKEDGSTVVLVTHDKDISGLAGRTVYLKDGIILN